MEPEENYKYGIFYYNKDDSRILVPKRVKLMGWTLNFAHPASYVIMGLILAVVVWAVVKGN